MIYLDHAATTPPCEKAIKAMTDSMTLAWHNPSATYDAAALPRKQLRLARRTISTMLNADISEIIFTSGGTEANSLAMNLARGKHAVISAIEHASVLESARRACSEITYIMPDENGLVSPADVEKAIRKDTALISVQFANNETGVIQPVREIGEIARKNHIPFHCDAVQAFGHIPVDVHACKIDLLTLSAHKFYGPRGTGALYVRQGIILPPIISGGSHELGRRAGTENVPAIWGMAAAAEIAKDEMATDADTQRALMESFAKKILEKIPGACRLGEKSPRLPGVSAFFLPGLSSEQAIADLDLLGVMVSGGAACASQDAQPSHVYRAMGLSETDAQCVIRISIGRETTREMLDSAADAIEKVYKKRVRP